MAKKIKLILAAFLVALSTGVFSINPAFADEGSTFEKQPIHLQVSPAKQKISLTPGASYVGSFRVMNVGFLEFDYEVYATPYSVSGENYNPDYVNEVTYSHMANWITFDSKTQKGTLQGDTSVEVSYTVNVPKDAPAGTQYAVLMAQTAAGNADDANIKTIHRVGTILSAAVPGETNACMKVEKNTINSFYFNPPITVSSLVRNCGNVEQTAKYEVRMWPLFSNEAVFTTESTPSEDEGLDIYPETSRFNSISWEGAPRIGIFKVQQIIHIGEDEYDVTKYVLICPLWLLFVIFALIFFIIFWLVSRARDRKRDARVAAGKAGKSEDKDSKESSNKKEEK